MSQQSKLLELEGEQVLNVRRSEYDDYTRKSVYLGQYYYHGDTGYKCETRKQMRAHLKAWKTSQAPKHATVTVLGVGEATKPALNPVVEAEMRQLGLIK